MAPEERLGRVENIETLHDNVVKNISQIQKAIDRELKNGDIRNDDHRKHHLLIRYAKLQLVLDRRLAAMKK
jgi:hypothetical protein